MSNPSVLKNGLTLALIAGVCSGLVAVTYAFTEDKIEDNRKAFLEQKLKPALSGLFFEGDVTESVVTLKAPHGLPGKDDALIYRLYASGEPVAALFIVTARNGYSGPIRILLGVDISGVVTGLRILEHSETPGLGDKIDEDKSDWVQQFAGRSLEDPAIDGWQIRNDGGEFDQLTGASITPRAVIQAVRETLVYFAENKEQVFAMPGDSAQ
ncbi:MAG: electron transport complex subunit RsxG [Woeseiaceae bacterium]|nr:electron transport complex subunit RsxG [Woeseiaceae bacterium]